MTPTLPMSPYGCSKLMTEIMLRDAATRTACALSSYAISMSPAPIPRAARDSRRPGTHLIKVACETASGSATKIEVFGTDYPTPDGTCIRDYIHVSDLAPRIRWRLHYLRERRRIRNLNCGYGRAIRCSRSSSGEACLGRRFQGRAVAAARRRPRRIVAAASYTRSRSAGSPSTTISTIVAQALAWERQLMTQFPRDSAAAASSKPLENSEPSRHATGKAAPISQRGEDWK